MAFLISSVLHPYLSEIKFAEADIAGFPRLDRCPACGSAEKPADLLQFGQPQWVDRVRLVQCGTCDHIYYSNPPAPAFFTHFYSQVWNSSRGESLQDGAAPRRRAKIKKDAVRLLKDLGKSDTAIRILEIGCGQGDMLAGLREAGYQEVYGTEASDYRAAASNERFPGRVFAGGYEAVPAGLTFDIIFSNHVVEHIYEPREAFAWMIGRLKPGGIIAITVPEAWGEPIIGQVLFLPHLHSFCHRSLRMMGRNAGFECVFWKAANTPYETTAVFFRPNERPALATDRFLPADTLGERSKPQLDRIQRPFRAPSRSGAAAHYALQADEEDSIRMAGEGGIRSVGYFQRLAARAALPLAKFLATHGFRKFGNKRLGRIRFISGRFVGAEDGVPVIGSIDGKAIFLIK